MLTVLTYLQTLAVAVLVGKVVLLSFVVAPVLARNLDPVPFGRVVRALFPLYYGLGMGAAGVGLLATGSQAVLQKWTEATVLAVVFWGMVLVIETYCRTPLTPQINALRDQMEEQEALGTVEPTLRARWESLHRRSVQLNSLVLLLGLALVGLG